MSHSPNKPMADSVHGDPFYRLLVKQVPTYFLGTMGSTVSGIVSIPIYAFFLRPEEYGLFSLAITVVGIFESFSGTFLANISQRFWFSFRKDQNTLLGPLGGIGMLAWGIALLSTATLLGLSTFKQTVLVMIIVGAMNIPFVIIRSILMEGARSESKVLLYSSSRLLISVGTVVPSTLLLFLGWGPMSLMLGVMIGNACAASILLWGLGVSPTKFLTWTRKGMENVPTFLTYGIPLIGTAMASWVFQLSDRVWIEVYDSTENLGLYAFSYVVGARGLTIIASLLALPTYPQIMREVTDNNLTRAALIMSSATRYYLIFSTPLLVIFFLKSDWIVLTLMGSTYMSGHEVLFWSGTAIFFYGMIKFTGVGYLTSKKTTRFLVLAILVAGINTAGNAVLVPKLGFMGAAYSTTASYFIYWLLGWLDSRQFLPWLVPWRTILVSILGCALVGTVLVTLPPISDWLSPINSDSRLGAMINLVVSITAAGFVYMSWVIIMGEIRVPSLIKFISKKNSSSS